MRAPAAGYIVHIQKFKWSELQTGREYDDYHFHILHTNTFMTFLGYAYDPAEHILQEAGELQYGDNSVWIPVEAGEVIGRSTGGDMGTYDRETILNFIRPERYEPLMLHAICPLDYFEPALREKLYEKVLRKGEPRGGR